ncbi:hypothetical protein PGSY75_0205700 [Plasmodium gaboni]|uniref:RRM domain-containing protein n=1 Tax=Plasmodium gaboni TaxID=647221 RepID=A0A151LWD6_9APIC|nr:hypothetical protein PGSY75_0205700 [Plasmodium gaboni]KYO03491.1 hypothetical protein PGSY75_0205700 [Plasmodium gaboni]SOV10335.1 conserved Plasmodium protein, unknown function [Plasmodium gaboni]SOV20619.1 conserved Plasmodium protein, unknown function [Plasmodium sp. DRC-Itaito]
MNELLNSNATIICNNIPININRFEITEIFSKYGPLLGQGIYFGKKNSNFFFVKYVHFKDAIKAYENLKNEKECEHDFKLSFSKNDEIKYKALKGNKKAIEELKNIYKQNDELKSQEDIGNYILNEINEQNNELLKKKKKEKEMEKKKDKAFILNLLTNIDETKENEQDIKLKEELKNYVNLNSLCSYHFDENNKYDNYLTPTFPN